MAWLISWGILIGTFLIAGYGLNLIRIAVVDAIANPGTIVGWRILLGSLLMLGGLSFLGGFVYHREKKKGKVGKPVWMKQKKQQ